MSSPEGEQGNEQNEQQEVGKEVSEHDQPQGSAPAIQEVSGGHHGKTYLGGQYGQYIGTQVNKTYNPVGASTKPQKPEQFQVSCLITVYEKDPISLSSRIFKGSLHSDVTGDRDAAVKITAAQKQNYREAKIYFSVPHHKNIVERFATDTFNFRGQPSIFIAMERCDCNLYNHVKSEVKDKVEFDVEKYTWISYQILVGLDFLHSRNVVHGDFKPANVLLILNGKIVKLSDFGLSKAVTQGNTSTQLTSPQGGTAGWQAPEILEGTMRISIGSDIFPCGLTLHFVWSHGKHAYGDRTVSLNHYIVEGINLDLSRMLVPFVDDAKVLLEKMLRRNPADRPSVREILQSRIFNRFGSQPTRVAGVDDAQVAEIFDQAVRFIKSEETEAANLSEDPLPISARQVQTAMQTLLERNQIRLITEERSMNLSLPVEEPRLSSSLSESALPPQSVDTEFSPSMDATVSASRAFERRSDATNPKQLFAGSQKSTSDNPVTTSHQSRNTGLAEASGSSQTSSGSTSLSLSVEEPISLESFLPPQFVDTEASSINATAFRAFEGQSEATNPKQLFPSSQKLTSDDPLTTSLTIDPHKSETEASVKKNQSKEPKLASRLSESFLPPQSPDTEMPPSMNAPGSSQTTSDSASLSLPLEEPRSASRSSESSLLPQSVDTDVAPFIDPLASRALEKQSEAADPEKLFVVSQKSTSDNLVTTSHQSRNTDSHRSESAEASASEVPSRHDVSSQQARKVTSAKQSPPSTQQPPQRSASANEGSVSGTSRPTSTLASVVPSRRDGSSRQERKVTSTKQSPPSTQQPPQRSASANEGSVSGTSRSTSTLASVVPSRRDGSSQQERKVTSTKQSPPSTQQPPQRSASANEGSVSGTSRPTSTLGSSSTSSDLISRILSANEPKLASRLSESFLPPQPVGIEVPPSVDASGISDTTNSKQLFAGSQKLPSDDVFMTSHQSKHCTTEESPKERRKRKKKRKKSRSIGSHKSETEASASESPSRHDVSSRQAYKVTSPKQSPPSTQPPQRSVSENEGSVSGTSTPTSAPVSASPAFKKQSEAANPEKLFVGSQKSTSNNSVMASHQSNTDSHRAVSEVPQTHEAPSQQARGVPSTQQSASANEGSVVGTSRPTSTLGSSQTSSDSSSLNLSVKEPRSSSGPSSLLPQSVDTEVASSTDAPGQSGAIDPKELFAGSRKLTSKDPLTTSHPSRNRTTKGPSKERLRRAKDKRKRSHRSESAEASASEVPQRHDVSSQQGRKVPSTRRSASAKEGSVAGTSRPAEGFPLCRRGCDVILISGKPSDKQHLPQLASKIYGTNPCNGRREFIHCGYQSIPEIILEQLSDMPDCDEGITMIIVAYLDATRPLSQALEEKNLKTFLLSKGLSGEHLRQKIQNMRRNLAVFALRPTACIGLDSAKIAVNIHLSKDESDGKLKTVTLGNGKVEKNITFQGPRLPDLEVIINNEEVTAFIRMHLRRLDNPEYCNKH